jgi:Bacterial Ig-like domain
MQQCEAAADTTLRRLLSAAGILHEEDTMPRPRQLFIRDVRILCLAAIVACNADGRIVAPPVATTPSPSLATSPFTVSAPYLSGTDASATSDVDETSPRLVYVALPQGAIPNAAAVTITAQWTGQSVTANVVDGAVDPVTINGDVGDRLLATVYLASGDSLKFQMLVPFSAPPTVIRLSPPANMMDVPVNANMLVEFSEPIAASSLAPAAVQLWNGSSSSATQVSGALAFGDDARLSVIFTPAAVLDPATTYTLSVGSDIRDSMGQALNATVAIEFTTADAIATSQSLARGRSMRRRP